jgi:thiol-disulfide isomerase/thioredoxin
MSDRLHMPAATAWLNSEPLSPEQLRGKVVLVDFWTLTCINWLRAQPYVRAWGRAYRDDGLVVVGVHTPEFTFEHDIDLVRLAVLKRGIDYPVAIDNDSQIWSAFGNHYWPALYFVDREGIIRDHHYGEGRYAESERRIQELLGVAREPLNVRGTGVEAEADWGHLRSPETYLGYSRGGRFVSPERIRFDEPVVYSAPRTLGLNEWALAGEWTVGPEDVFLHEVGGGITFRFLARDVNIVLYRESREPVPFRVFVDGRAPGRSHGVDVDENGDGVLREGRMYQLVRQSGEVRDRRVEITFLDAGAEAYAFTFG